ncbi:MAG: hypothetical protein JNN15_21540, partial [Blastocatellia bacterium]|nr:hypothetical protein [Blastocatellia bacterium]
VAFIKDLPVEIEHACANDVEKGYKQVRIFVEDETRVGLMESVKNFV